MIRNICIFRIIPLVYIFFFQKKYWYNDKSVSLCESLFEQDMDFCSCRLVISLLFNLILTFLTSFLWNSGILLNISFFRYHKPNTYLRLPLIKSSAPIMDLLFFLHLDIFLMKSIFLSSS